MTTPTFSQQLLDWFQHQGRKTLPWQQTQDPYRIWVSEIMLQQTQVITVIDYYQRFMQRFADVASLAAASTEEVLHYWAGLGYYSRARNLHKCAQQVVAEHQGRFPVHDQALMEALPGIGPSTAAAIRAFSTGVRAVILDGNVKRVIARYFAISGWPGQTQVNRQLWQKADELTPSERLQAYTQAIMDLGALICTPRKPQCHLCPVASGCQALQQDKVSQLPTPRPTKTLPEQTRHALLLQDDQGRLLLERRPTKGIWAELWSLPEFEEATTLNDWLQHHFPQARINPEQPATQKHTFSHYRLHLQLLQARLPATQKTIQEPPVLAWQHPNSLNWYDPAQPASIGLAAPVNRIIQQADNN